MLINILNEYIEAWNNKTITEDTDLYVKTINMLDGILIKIGK